MYDIHGNLGALEAVLDAAEAEGFDRLLCGGDMAMLGPEPAACIDRLRAYGDRLIAIRGNTDRWVASDQADESLEWTRAAIGAERTAWLGSLPPDGHVWSTTISWPCTRPRGSDEDIILPETPEPEVAAELADVVQHTVLYGHVHIQYRRVGGRDRTGQPRIGGAAVRRRPREPRGRWSKTAR